MGPSTGTGSPRRIWASAAHASEIALGAFAIAVGFGIIGWLDADVLGLLFGLATGVFLLGLREITLGIATSDRRKAIRLLRLVAGVATVGLGFVVAIFSGFGVATLIAFLFLALFAFGAAQVGVGAGSPSVPPWFRGYLVAVGMLNLLLAPLLVVMPGQPRITLVLLASVALVVDGFGILVSRTVERRILPTDSAAAHEGHP